MSSIEFEEPKFSYRAIDISTAISKNTPYLIRYGIVKDLRRANQLMAALVIVMIIGAIFIYTSRPSATIKKYKEDFTQEELDHMHPDMVRNLPSRPQ